MEEMMCYNVPENYAVELLAKEIANLKWVRDNLKLKVNAYYECEAISYERLSRTVNELVAVDKREKDCQDALKTLFKYQVH